MCGSSTSTPDQAETAALLERAIATISVTTE
jgi:hypothetical protein